MNRSRYDIALYYFFSLDQQLNFLNNEQKKSYEYFNIGTGKGSSVLEVIQAFERINHTKVPYEVVDRRTGDIVKIYADTTRANHELNWKAQLNLDDMMKSAWKWQKTLIS